MKKADLRKHRTRLLFNSAFMNLLKEKNFANITVKDLISCAELNRSTFYLHYLDMPDFIDKLLLQTTQELKVELSKLFPLKNDQLHLYYQTYLHWFNKHRSLLLALDNSTYSQILYELDNTYISSLVADNKMLVLYITTANKAIFYEWLRNNQTYNLDEFGQFVAKVTSCMVTNPELIN